MNDLISITQIVEDYFKKNPIVTVYCFNLDNYRVYYLNKNEFLKQNPFMKLKPLVETHQGKVIDVKYEYDGFAEIEIGVDVELDTDKTVYVPIKF